MGEYLFNHDILKESMYEALEIDKRKNNAEGVRKILNNKYDDRPEGRQKRIEELIEENRKLKKQIKYDEINFSKIKNAINLLQFKLFRTFELDENGIIYFLYKEGCVDKTVEYYNEQIHVDLDAEGNIIGVEVLSKDIKSYQISYVLRCYGVDI